MRPIIALAFATVAISPAAALPLHQFSDLTLSPAGDRVAAGVRSTERVRVAQGAQCAVSTGL